MGANDDGAARRRGVRRLPVLAPLLADENKDLLAPLAPYLEYDVYPKTSRQPTPPQRVVRSRSHPYASWFTPDHYATFRYMFPPQCLTLPTRRLLP